MSIRTSVIFLLVFFLFFLFVTVFDFDNDEVFSSILDFLSIMTGFSITALSIIAVSKFSKELYKIEDSKDNSMTLLHRLVHKFKVSTMLYIFTIFFILLYGFLPQKKPVIVAIGDFEIYISVFIKGLVWSFTILCLYKFVELFWMFSDFVIKSVKSE